MTSTKNKLCLDCQKPCSGLRCAQHAAAARIGKPRGVAKPGTKSHHKEPSTRELYPLPMPSPDTSPLTLDELDKAKCKGTGKRGADDDVCFPDDNSNVEAKMFCHGCPIQARCLTIGRNETIGIWGGATVGERKKIARKFFQEVA